MGPGWLLSAAAVRQRSETLWRHGVAGTLPHLRVDQTAWEGVLAAVADQVGRHPAGPIPVHGRLNHLRGDGWDLASQLLTHVEGEALVDAVVVSVLLDAGAGPAWTFADPVAGLRSRSEGLAVAALRLVQSGRLAGDGTPWRVDADGLVALTPAMLAEAFQVGPSNPLAGLEGRAGLLTRLGRILQDHQADSVGDLLRRDLLDGRDRVAAADLLGWVLTVLGPLWPGRLCREGVALGDTWPHPLAGGHGATAGLVPFHKLSQWLTYSLVEPLAHRGITVTGLEQLTGLAEYRNGGMLLELGLLVPHHDLPDTAVPAGDPLVVEWRALTVAALDRILARLDPHLPAERRGMTMAQLLEAGTWPLGRRLARRRDPDGRPPISVASDGTVF